MQDSTEAYEASTGQSRRYSVSDGYEHDIVLLGACASLIAFLPSI